MFFLSSQFIRRSFAYIGQMTPPMRMVCAWMSRCACHANIRIDLFRINCSAKYQQTMFSAVVCSPPSHTHLSQFTTASASTWTRERVKIANNEQSAWHVFTWSRDEVSSIVRHCEIIEWLRTLGLASFIYSVLIFRQQRTVECVFVREIVGERARYSEFQFNLREFHSSPCRNTWIWSARMWTAVYTQ